MIFSYFLTLFGVCGLAVGSLVVLRAVKGGEFSLAAVQPIRVVGRQTLGSGATLMLVEVDGQRLLVGASRAGINVLHTLTPFVPSAVEALRTNRPLDCARDERAGGHFSATLKRAGTRW